MNLAVQYRGPLTSCNYACTYCPFAKRAETPAQLQRDQDSIVRLVAWFGGQARHTWRILFTPWGEALVRAWYRRAIVELSRLPQVQSVAVQTNLSCDLRWLGECNPERVAFWATWHPSEAPLAKFRRQVQRVCDRGIRCSVGIVAVPDQLESVSELRSQLPDEIYLWINAQQPRRRPYSTAEVELLTRIDPQFPLTLKKIRSRDRFCQAGEASFTIDGSGDMRRCHFVAAPIGNIFQAEWEAALLPRPCPNQFCQCYLGKAQLEADRLAPFFGEQTLERISR